MNRLILAEPGLESRSRHEPAHARALAAESARRGIGFVALASTLADANSVNGFMVRKTFRINVYAQPRSIAPLRVLLTWRSWSRYYYEEFAAALSELRVGPDDLLLLNTVKIALLDGMSRWLAGRAAYARPLVAVILRLEMDEGLPGGAMPRVSRWLYRRVLNKLHNQLGARLLLATDACQIGGDFERLIARPVADIPLPIEVPEPAPPRRLAETHLVFPSSARGRGFHLLPDALDKAFAGNGQLRATIRVPTQHQQRKLNAPFIERLRAMSPRVRLIEGMLDEQRFYALLADADVVLLPYDPGLFAKRSSQILAQTAAIGRPAIVMAGSFLDRECQAEGIVGVTAGAFTHEALADAIGRFVADRERLAAAAWAACPAQRQRHSVTAFMDRLVEFAGSSEAPRSGRSEGCRLIDSTTVYGTEKP